MRGRFPISVAACFLLFAAGCLPSKLRLPPSEAGALLKIAVVPVESPGMDARFASVYPSPGGLVRLAGAHDNGVLFPDSHGVLHEGVPVFVHLPAEAAGGSGTAERFEKALAGPSVVWNPAVDLAEACARLLRESGRESNAYREPVRLPGIARRGPEDIPLDWRASAADWYEKDPEPVDMLRYRDRGYQAVLLVVPDSVVAGPVGTTVVLRAKLADPSSGRVLARAQAQATGPGRQFPGKFPAGFNSLAANASKEALKGMGLVR